MVRFAATPTKRISCRTLLTGFVSSIPIYRRRYSHETWRWRFAEAVAKFDRSFQAAESRQATRRTSRA
jgi:hypothetical protein